MKKRKEKKAIMSVCRERQRSIGESASRREVFFLLRRTKDNTTPRLLTSKGKTDKESNQTLLKGKLRAVLGQFLQTIGLLLFCVIANFSVEGECGFVFQVLKGKRHGSIRVLYCLGIDLSCFLDGKENSLVSCRCLQRQRMS